MGVKLGLTMRKGRRLRVFENRVFKKRHLVREGSKRGWRIWEYRAEAKCIEFWWRNLKDTDHLEKPRRGLEHNIKKGLKEIGCKVVDWIKWLRTRTAGRLFCRR